MITNDQTGRTLLVGNEVRMVPGTLLSAGRPSLHNHIGRVTQLLDDGTSVKRITVVFDGIEPIEGVDEAQFEKVLL